MSDQPGMELVEVEPSGHHVYLSVRNDTFDEPAFTFLSPQQARRLSLDLTMAAERAEAAISAAALVVEEGQS